MDDIPHPRFLPFSPFRPDPILDGLIRCDARLRTEAPVKHRKNPAQDNLLARRIKTRRLILISVFLAPGPVIKLKKNLTVGGIGNKNSE